MAEYVPFVLVEDGDDLIVSFALGEHAADSLTLLRTPMFEPLLPEEDRGVSVGTVASATLELELLVSVQWGDPLVRIESTVRRYTLNIRAVDPEAIREAKTVLLKMNFDKRFVVKDA